MISERDAFPSKASYALNVALFPLKMIVPQPFITKVPGLVSNFDIRTNIALAQCRGRVLDIGCGKNSLVKVYRSRGGVGLGVDVYDWGDVDLVVEDTAVLPYPDASFDTVTFVACINHIPNRVAVLREAKRLLAPGGRVVLTNLTPKISRIWHAWAYWDADQHERGMKEGEVYGFTDAELRAVLADGGLRVTERSAFSWGLNSIYVAQPAKRTEPNR